MSRTFRKILPILGVVIALGATPAFAQSDLPAEMRAAIDAAANAALKDSGAPGASIAVVKDGKLAYVQAYGDAKIDPKAPAKPAMRYSIGSVSKQFTATAILMLAEDGKLSLDDPVGKFLPNLTRANEVTIRQLLSHTSGYQDYWPQDYVPPFMLQEVTAAQILDMWAKKPLDFEPGTQYQYSNTGYVAAGVIVEKASGKPLLEFLGSRVFAPLGMASIVDIDRQTLGPNDPVGYKRYGLGPLRVAPKEGKGWLFAAGELAMTAEDLARWDIGMIDQKLLKPGVVQADADGHAAQERSRHPLRPRHHRLAARRPAHARARRRGLGVHGGERVYPGRPRGHRGARQPGLDRHVRNDRPEDRRDPLRPGRGRTRRGARAAGHGRAAEGQGRPRDLHVQRQQLLHRPGPRGFRRRASARSARSSRSSRRRAATAAG